MEDQEDSFDHRVMLFSKDASSEQIMIHEVLKEESDNVRIEDNYPLSPLAMSNHKLKHSPTIGRNNVDFKKQALKTSQETSKFKSFKRQGNQHMIAGIQCAEQ